MYPLSFIYPRFISIFFIVLFVLAATACSSGNSSVSTHKKAGGGISLPKALKTDLPDNGTLTAFIRVDGGQRQQMTLIDESAIASLSGLTQGSHTFTVEFEFVFNANPDKPLILASATKVLDLAPGDNALNITETDYNTDSFDEDGDGQSNLIELKNNSNPFAGFIITAVTGNTTEDGTSITFTIALTMEPVADVTIAITSSDTTEGAVDRASMTFSSSNWNVAQKVTVTGIDDSSADGNQTFSIQLAPAASSDSQFDGQNPPDVSVTNVDNDSPGFNISPISGNTAEGGTSATFTAQLTTQPTTSVTIAISSSDTSEGTVDNASITFDTNNWNTAQTITIAGVDDNVNDGDQSYTIVLAAAVSDDTNYSGLDPNDVTVINTDNDAPPSVVLSLDQSSIAEAAGVVIVTATLGSMSDQDVIVNLIYSGTSTVGEDYTHSNSISIPKGSTTGAATITALQDNLDEDNETIVIDISSVTNGIESGTQRVTATITDDDQQPTVTLSINTASPLAEASGSANLTATLSDKSGRAVTVNLLYSGNATAATDYVKSDAITIAAGNTFAQATLTAINDTSDENDESIIVDIDTVTNGVEVTPQQVTAIIADDDAPPVINFSTTSQNVFENVGTVTLPVTLGVKSAFDVSVPYTVSGTATGGGTDHDLTNGVISIPAGQTTETISFVVRDDSIDESNETVIVTLGSPVNATLGTTNTHIVTITANDNIINVLSADPQSRSVKLTWNDTNASSYNLYYASEKGFDPDNYASFTGGTLLTNVTSPITITNLVNGTAYYFVLEAAYATGLTRSEETASRPNEWVLDNTIYTIATGDDATVYLGGDFKQVGTMTGSGMPLSTSTGKPIMGDFPVVNGVIYASVADGQGGWYIGGDFTRVDGVARNRLAHILADGSLDLSWNPDANNIVQTLAVDGNTVYVGGSFTSIGGTPRNNLAAINTDGTLASWNPDANDVVFTLAVDGATVYVGGAFSSIGGVSRNRLAAIGTDGTLISWNPDSSGLVLTLVINGSMVYVGGQFNSISGTSRNNLAAIGTDGILANWNPDADHVVFALAVDGNTVYVGGFFTSIGGTPRNYLAAITTGGTLTSWNPDAEHFVYTLVVNDNIVYVGGGFTTISGTPRINLAAIATDGTLTNWNPNANNVVESLAVDGATVYVGGRFSSIGGVSRNRLAAIAADGTLTNWNPDANNIVDTLAVAGNTVYVGGQFTTINGTPRNHLAAFDTGGALTSWDPDSDGRVLTLKVSGNTVYVGGQFTNISNTPRNRLAAIGTGGTLINWNPDANNIVETLSVDGSTVYVGGQFTTISGTPRNRLAAIGTGGTLTNWNPDADNIVETLAVDGTTVYVGGHYTTISGMPRNRLAAIGVDGTLTSWNPDADNIVETLAVDGNTVYVGGQFTTISGALRNRLAAIGADGTISSWNPELDNKAFETVLTLVIDGATVYVGGRFTRIGNRYRSRFATIGIDGALK